MMEKRLDGTALEEFGSWMGDALHVLGEGRSWISVWVNRIIVGFSLFASVVITCACAKYAHTGEFSCAGAVTIALFAASLLAFMGWLLYFLHPWFRMWWVRVGVGCLLFVWGFVTFFYFPVEKTDASDFTARILRATNRTSTTMFIKRGGYGKPMTVRARFFYGAFQTALVFYIVGVLFSVFGRTAMNHLQRIFVWNDAWLHVFWGLTERDRLLARSIRAADCYARIEFNLPVSTMNEAVKQARLTDLADQLHAFWIFVNLTSAQTKKTATSSNAFVTLWRKMRRFVSRLGGDASVIKGRYHYFLGDDGHENMSMANRLVSRIVDDPSVFGEWKFFVRAGDIDNEGFFLTWADDVYRKSGRMVSVHVIRDSEMIARDFVSRFPPVSAKCLHGCLDADQGTVSGECRTLLLGFDRVGRELLNVSLCLSGFVGADGKSMVQFPFTIVDMKPERWERYEVSFPGIFEDNVDYRLDFKCMQVGMLQFDNWFRQNHANYDRIILCLKDDAANMREALRIREILQEELADDDETSKKEIFIRVQNPKLSESLVIGEECDGRVAIKTFGDMIQLYSVGSFYSESVDRLAAVMNWRWHKNCEEDVLRLDEGREFHKDLQDEITRYWIDDPLYNRRSSRIQALRCMTFCRMKGWVIDRDEYGQNRLMTEQLDGVEVCDENGKRKRVPISYELLKAWIKVLLDGRSVLHRLERRRWCTYIRVCGYRSFVGKESELASLEQRAEGRFVPNQLKAFRRHAGLNDLDDDAPVIILKNTSCWRVFADAALLAGYCERNIPEAEAERLSWWEREKMVGRTLRGALKRIVTDRNDASKNLCNFGEIAVREQIVRCAELADIYTARVESGELSVEQGQTDHAVNFLNSKEVFRIPKETFDCEGVEGLSDSIEIFWFADPITPHFDFRRRRLYKTRFPYVYDRCNGMIRPFSTLSPEAQRKVKEGAGINGRLVDFKSQPHFVARVTEEEFDGQKVMVVAFCGTEGAKDWIEDGMQCLGYTPPQFRLAADLVKAVCETMDGDEKVYLVGHSEGGGEVQYSLMRNAAWKWCQKRMVKGKIRGFTFNSQRLSPRVLRNLRYDTDAGRQTDGVIENYRIESDLVSGCRELGASLMGAVFSSRLSSTEHGSMPGKNYVKKLGFIKYCRQTIRAHSLRSIIEELKSSKYMEDGKELKA